MLSHRKLAGLAMSLEGKIKLLGRTTRENADLLDQCADTPDAGLAVIMGHVIHDFYNSVEDIFESIAGTFGEMPEKTDAWHKVHIPGQSGRSFRGKAAAYSAPKRPPRKPKWELENGNSLI